MYFVRMLVAFFLLLAPTRALAGTVQLPQTGQTTCYDASGVVILCANSDQDGEIRAGVPWPEPRFLDNGDQTVTDNMTGLMWSKDANLILTRDPAFDTDITHIGVDGAVNWQQALDYVQKLNTENYLGFNNWRLPNLNELSSIITLGQPNTINWLKTQGFINFPTGYGWYWSSSNRTNSAWGVSLSQGAVTITSKVSNRFYVWPIRDGQPVSFGAVALPVTGQATCYNANGNLIACTGTGQDGELQKGVAWPTTRFTTNGDQTTSLLTT